MVCITNIRHRQIQRPVSLRTEIELQVAAYMIRYSARVIDCRPIVDRVVVGIGLDATGLV